MRARCKDCLHFDVCDGPVYGCYAVFPSDEGENADSDLGVPDTLDEARDLKVKD